MNLEFLWVLIGAHWGGIHHHWCAISSLPKSCYPLLDLYNCIEGHRPILEELMTQNPRPTETVMLAGDFNRSRFLCQSEPAASCEYSARGALILDMIMTSGPQLRRVNSLAYIGGKIGP